MTAMRSLVLALVVIAAVVVQSSVLTQFSVYGVVPDLVLMVVVATALVRGPEFGCVVGFFAGLMADLAPPADHAAGRWALALTVVGFLAGRLRNDVRGRLAVVAVVGTSSFLATSIFALSGLVLNDTPLPVGNVVLVVLISAAFDLIVAPLLVPPLMALIRQLRPPRVTLG